MAEILDPLPAGPTDPVQIAAFEQYVGYPLPADYRAFLLRYNGGHPDPDAFPIDTGLGEQEDGVMCFFPMCPLSVGAVVVNELEELRTWPIHCAWDDLQSDLENLYAEAGIQEALLPIGTDGSSNYFCIVLDGERKETLVFLDHETGELFPLGANFDAFLASLRRREDEE
jgi:hypothetical protein